MYDLRFESTVDDLSLFRKQNEFLAGSVHEWCSHLIWVAHFATNHTPRVKSHPHVRFSFFFNDLLSSRLLIQGMIFVVDIWKLTRHFQKDYCESNINLPQPAEADFPLSKKRLKRMWPPKMVYFRNMHSEPFHAHAHTDVGRTSQRVYFLFSFLFFHFATQKKVDAQHINII